MYCAYFSKKCFIILAALLKSVQLQLNLVRIYHLINSILKQNAYKSSLTRAVYHKKFREQMYATGTFLILNK